MEDIKRLIVNTHAIEPEFLLQFIGIASHLTHLQLFLILVVLYIIISTTVVWYFEEGGVVL